MARRGRPTKYKRQYCEEIVRYFDIPRTETKKVTVITKMGATQIEKVKATEWPTLSGFARQIGVNQDTLKEWAKNHPEFSAAVKKAKELQEDFLIHNGLDGFYQPNIFALVATNFTSMKSKETKEVTGPEGGPVPMTYFPPPPKDLDEWKKFVESMMPDRKETK